MEGEKGSRGEGERGRKGKKRAASFPFSPSPLLPFFFSERLSSGVARLDLVPPFDVVAFAEFPAEQYDAPVAHGGEIHQPTREVLQLHAERLQLARAFAEPHERADVAHAVPHEAAACFSAFSRELRRLLPRQQVGV